MAQKNLVSLADQNGVVVAETLATPNTVPLRDNAGGVAMGPSTFTGVTPTIFNPVIHANVTTAATLDNTAVTWPVDATAAAVPVTLPTAVGIANQLFIVGKVDASTNAVTVLSGTNTLATLSSRYAKFIVQSNGTLWI